MDLWAIWLARRKEIHEKIFKCPFSIFKFIGKFIDELNISYVSTRARTVIHSPRPTAPVWLPPPDDRMKINVDAAVA
jgi:hypothetical protein